MLTGEQRATKAAMWLAHWRGWKASGVSMAEYARREGFDVDAAYRWKRVLRRTGQWAEATAAPAVKKKKRVAAVRFARVSVSDMPRRTSMLLWRRHVPRLNRARGRGCRRWSGAS